jgi:hypothetical protein
MPAMREGLLCEVIPPLGRRSFDADMWQVWGPSGRHKQCLGRPLIEIEPGAPTQSQDVLGMLLR